MEHTVYENARRLKEKMRRGQLCVGTGISFTDPTVTEALCEIFDFVWIDMEHNALSLEAVQGHLMATNGSHTTPLVRVAWNDPVLVKPLLDIGAAGIIAPQVRTAEEARLLVAACRYPPEGIRGYGPRRAGRYGRVETAALCREANESILTIAQIEHIDAVRNLEEILAVPGLTSIVLGPNDLAGSMGHIGNPRHPEVLEAIATVIAKARRTEVFVGVSGGDEHAILDWVRQGGHWASVANDYSLMLKAAEAVSMRLREGAAVAAGGRTAG